MSAIKVINEIAQKYKMEKFDYEWIKMIVEETIKISEDYEKLQIKYEKIQKGLNNILKGETK